ncbi:TPA: hypothetical protein N0F65_007005 [Lagenidium giganteum]|uniref:Trafficking protein particle complex subunit 13 n=1 Tax=Lagenidium giganteum TaxID=4803 RepID=A0AAV2ZDA5_9STRA|nr:TPA: hypothetical protein N0F65_007005 [Lagenidium giganteum]
MSSSTGATTPYAPTAGAGAAGAAGAGAGAGAPASSASVQPTLKVMRLYKPKLYTQGASSGSMMPTALSESSMLQHEFTMSSMLILPDSFGEIFLGNTFSSYISVINPYSCDVREVGLTANIQCANDRVDLHDNRYARTGKVPPPNPVKVLHAGTSLDMVVDYPLTQVGNHVLRVGVTYLDPITNEPKSLRKFYRFGVQNPLVINFKQLRVHDESFVEAQIRNVSKLPLFIDDIRFLPLLPFAAQEFEAPSPVIEQSNNSDQALLDEVRDLLTHGSETLLNPQEELQRVFRLYPDPTADPSPLQTQGSQNLGKLHVGWKTSVGETGSVQSQPVMRKVDHGREVTVTLTDLPKEIILGSPFRANCAIQNNSTRSLQLQLQFRKDKMTGVFCYSLSHQNIGVIPPKATHSVAVEFLPTIGGLQLIQGAVCVDTRTGQEFIQDVLARVMVHAIAAPVAA